MSPFEKLAILRREDQEALSAAAKKREKEQAAADRLREEEQLDQNRRLAIVTEALYSRDTVPYPETFSLPGEILGFSGEMKVTLKKLETRRDAGSEARGYGKAGTLQSRVIGIDEITIVLTPEEASKFLPEPVDVPWTLRYVNCGVVVDYDKEGIPMYVDSYRGFSTFSQADFQGLVFTNSTKVPELTDKIFEEILKNIAQ